MPPSARALAAHGARTGRCLITAAATLTAACFDSTSPNDRSGSTSTPSATLASFASTCPSTASAVTGQLPDGALFELCIPPAPMGLVLYAHGYSQAADELAIHDEEIPDGLGGTMRLSELTNSLGFVFGATSYPHVGLNGREGVTSLALLKQAFTTAVGPLPAGAPTYVAGVSEGGMVAGLAAETMGGDIQGVLSTCGPVGDFQAQLDYFGDFRVLFDYFFPGVLGAAWTNGPDYGAADRAYVASHWDQYQARILAALQAHPLAAAQLIATSRAPIDPLDPASVGETVVGVLWYNIFATDDARQRLGGRPFDNHNRVYRGSFNDARLNARVQRFTAEPTALATIASDFQTTGALELPVVTDHTLLDPIVKASQELLYAGRVALAGQSARLTELTVPRYGHCAFTAPELEFALATLVGKTTSPVVAAKMPAAKVLPAMAGAPRFGAFARLGTPMTH
jgi:hypothetical protein